MKYQKKIHEAIKSGDAAFLSAAGRKGAEAAAEAKRTTRAEDDQMVTMIREMEQERTHLDETLRKRQANEHILSSEGEAFDYEVEEDDEDS